MKVFGWYFVLTLWLILTLKVKQKTAWPSYNICDPEELQEDKYSRRRQVEKD